MILRGIEDRNQDADNAFSVSSIRESLGCVGDYGVTGQEGACQITNGRDDYSEVIAAVPKTIIGCLITENLNGVS